MSGELLASKVVVVEEEPKVRGIPSAPTSVAGAVGVTEKGPANKAVLCSSFDEYQDTFGGYTATADVALAAKGFFENGGSQLWVSRVTSATAATATTQLSGDGDLGTTPVLQVNATGPGVLGNLLSIESTVASNGASDQFDLFVSNDGVVTEQFANLSRIPNHPRFVETVVNTSSTRSLLVRITSLDALPGVPPNVTATLDLTGGSDGAPLTDSDFTGNEGAGTGLHALDRVPDIGLLLVPGRATSAVHGAMLQYCEITRYGTVFAILDPPAAISATDMVTYVSTTASLEGSSEYGAIYWPRLKVLNPSKSVFGDTSQIVVPPSGIVAGVFARTDSARPGGVYDVPAGIEAGRLLGVLDFDNEETRIERKRDIVYPHRINPLTKGPSTSPYIDGSRTLKGDGAFPFVASRRGVIFIERSLSTGLQFARHKVNTPELRAQVRRTVQAFLLTQMNNGAFASQDPAKAFFVDVSDKINSPSVVADGKLIVKIGLATTRPAEYVVLQISQDTRAIEAELASG